MRNEPRKIILDTNLFISFLITRNHTQLIKFFFQRNWILIFGDELIQELIEVAMRSKFRRFFSTTDIEDLLIGTLQTWEAWCYRVKYFKYIKILQLNLKELDA